MKQRFMFILSTVLIAILTAVLVLVLTSIISLVDALPLGISLLALIVSILSSFKDELFPFQLYVFADGLHLVRTPALPPNSDMISIVILLPVTFFNRGYSEGIVQSIRLKVIGEKSGFKHDFLPSVEVDMGAFVQQKVGLNASNTIGTFVGFLVESKKAVKKNIVFTPLIEKGKNNVLIWQPDIYYFELHVQTFSEKKPKKYFEFKQEIHSGDFMILEKSNSLFFYGEWKDD